MLKKYIPKLLGGYFLKVKEPEYIALPDIQPIISDLTVDGTILYNFNSQKIDIIELIQYDNGNKKVIQLDLPSLDKNDRENIGKISVCSR